MWHRARVAAARDEDDDGDQHDDDKGDCGHLEALSRLFALNELST